MNVAKYGEDPRYMKVGKQLTEKKIEGIKNLLGVIYEDLGDGIPIEVVSYSIPLILEAKFIRQI